MPWWMVAAFALCMVSLGLAVLVDPANFAPTITDPKALKRRRIFNASGFLLMGCLMGIVAFLDFTSGLLSRALDRGWFTFPLPGFFLSLLGGCSLIMFAVPAIHVWFQITSRARERRNRNADRLHSSLD